MIEVDYHTGSIELMPIIQRIGVKCEKGDLQYGDVAFEGNGPLGRVMIGIERKALHDMLNCIDDARYTGHQRIGMKQMYDVSVLMVEGHWKPHDGNGLLMEGFSGGTAWGYCRYRSQRSMYAKLYRYLISVALSGVIVTFSRDMFQTAFNCVEWFHYFQKPWSGHGALQEMQKIAIPTLNHKPSLVRKWANDIEGVGVKKSEDAERLFKTPIALAQGDEMDWVRVPGIGVQSAQKIVREVWGLKK